MNIIISGGSGYIGSCLIKKFLKQKVNIAVITRTLNKVLIDSKGKCEIYEADLTKPFGENLKTQFDIFIHLAAANDVDSLSFETALSSTVLTTKTCLDLCQINHIKKFIYFSTFQVYGKADGDMSEETVPMPNNDYGITHLFAEEYVKMFCRASEMQYIILRPTNVYGAPAGKTIDRWTLVPNCFCKEAFERQTITLFSSGKQLRDFVSLNDLAGATCSLCNEFQEFENCIINVSSGNSFSILEIAQLVKAQYEKMFLKQCEIEIRSGLPKFANAFKINRKQISGLDYEFDSRESIVDGIQETFSILKAN
jgi:UDP-glucose 4-epimerase